jgi:formate hydrogenlyase subunit 3/multisubunit Na+/H+ antiporter MnhD subunit
VVASACNVLGIWVGIVINLLSRIPLLCGKLSKQKITSAVYYFLVQSIGASAVLLGAMCLFFKYSDIGHSILLVGLVIKLGLFPLYSWLPRVIRGLS